MRSYGTTMERPGRSLQVGWTFPTEAQFKSKTQYYIDQFAYDSTAIPATLAIEDALVLIPKSDTKALRMQIGKLAILQRRQQKVLSYIKDRLQRTGGLVVDQTEVDRERLTLANAKKSVEFILSRTNALLVAAENELAKRNRNKTLLIVLPLAVLVGIGIYRRRK